MSRRALTRLDEATEDAADRAPDAVLCGAVYPLDPSQRCARQVGDDGTHPGVHDSSPVDSARGVAWRDDV